MNGCAREEKSVAEEFRLAFRSVRLSLHFLRLSRRFGGLHVLRIGHTVGDYRGFQRNHGAIVVKCKLHFGRDFEILTHATFLRNFYYFIFA